MKQTFRLRSATATLLMNVILLSYPFLGVASVGKPEKSNPELIAFLVASALGTRIVAGASETATSVELVKSPNRAFLSSLLVPGAGQLYVGAKRGYLYITADIALLISYFITYSDAETTRDDYREVVRRHVIFDGPGTFETWDPIEDFEHATLFDNWHNVYTENDGQPLERVGKWYWDDRAAFKDEDRAGRRDSRNREEALGLRENANETFELARTLLGGVIFNHVISAVEARIAAKNYNKKNGSQTSIFKSVELDLQTTLLPRSVESQLVLRGQF